MSSDSSGKSKINKVVLQKAHPVSKIKNNLVNSSDESDSRQTSEGSKESQKSIRNVPQPKITVLEQLSYKRSDLHLIEDGPKGTATTHNSTAPTVITAVLRDLRDDIVRSPDYRQSPGPLAIVNGDRAIAVIGGDNVYVQSKTKFIPVPREKALSSLHSEQHLWPYHTSRLEQHSPLDIAILVQKVFTPLSSMCFGLLGGVALLQLILVHQLVGDVTSEDQKFFLQSYSKFAELTPLLFYILLAVCIVSVLDRISLERETKVWQPSWVVLIVYTLTLLLTLSCATYDDRLTLYPQNKTLFQNEMQTHELVSHWQLLNTLRCISAILGWVIFSLTSPPDMLLHHLMHVKQFEHSTHTPDRDLH